MKKKLCIYICLIFILILPSGCIQKKVQTISTRKYVMYNIGVLPKDLLMLDNDNIRQQDLLLCLFEGLISVDKNDEIVPALAYEWNISDDGLCYTFKMREKAKWSNGRKIKAQDFVEFFSKVLICKNNIYKEQLYCIFGAKDYVENKVDFKSVAITAIDDKTLEIRLNYPCSYFLQILSQPIYALRKDFKYLEDWKNKYSSIMYSGPFNLDNIIENDELCLIKNNEYWDKKSVLSEKIHISSEKMDAFAVADYKANETDIIVNPPISVIDEFIKKNEFFQSPSIEGISLKFNLYKGGVITNSDFRKSINYCINRNDIVENKLEGVGEAAVDYIPENINEESKAVVLDLYSNIDKAKKFLEKSKYNGQKIKIAYFNNKDINKKIVNSIVKALKILNINVSSEGYNEDELKKVINNGEYDILLSNYQGEYNFSMCFLEKYSSDSIFNIYGYKSHKFDEAILKAKIAQTKEKQIEFLNKAKEILIDDMPCIPICFVDNIVCKKNYIKNIEINKKGNIILKRVYVNNNKLKP
ncbi:peptide ABC transporter substrate-binding protein [Clostridium aestuarii]|uniref:Peptide ABC transporter substrate-binding protein n=1 Tax=Clostridium aestuarii TaxID=338193 RepID=A0ABT4CZJ8_9CLOT|nr:peptide ABC transporter substrate-binding protein [Clostridium aestuarii]MCY6484409.1 peptide ABC transporter substrate-binding protein [Clostridium aestuarii]